MKKILYYNKIIEKLLSESDFKHILYIKQFTYIGEATGLRIRDWFH